MRLERAQIAAVAAAILMVWLAASALFGESGVVSWMHRRRERARVGADTMRLAERTYELERRIARLASGDGLEAVAREQLGLVRPNEVVYRFRPAPAARVP